MYLLMLADGFEEIEAITFADILRRAQIDVKTVSVTENKNVTGSHKISFCADLTCSEVDIDSVDGAALPGGLPGADNLEACEKLCGILTEMSADMDQIHYVIVGIGINVQMTDFPKEIQNTATSLKLVTGKTLLRNELLAKVLEEFEVLYEQFVSAESLKNLKAEYESRLANKDNRVNVLAPSGAWQGICLGIKEDGALLVQREDGKVEEVIAGEVSVRGIYGYV